MHTDRYLKIYFIKHVHYKAEAMLIISPNEVFGDIMVLASLPRPPIDPDDINALNSRNIQWISFKFDMKVDTPLRYVAIEI